MTQKVALRKTSLVDYPGLVSAVIFFPFCNLRCPWCQNGDLVLGKGADLVPLEEALTLIEKRRSVLGGVVLSGGEPCLYDGLAVLIGRIKEAELKVKLDTNGTRPEVLAALFAKKESAPDFIAMDLKTSPRRYREFCANGADAETVADSVRCSAFLVRESGIPHEFRSLAFSRRSGNSFFTSADIASLFPLAGKSPWKIRAFRPGGCLNPDWNYHEGADDNDIKELETAKEAFHG